METNSFIVTIGSNDNAEDNISSVKALLQEEFAGSVFSPFQWTPPVGLPYSKPFLNGAIRLSTLLSPEALKIRLKAIEVHLGRTPEMKAMGIVPIDLDIITFNEHIVHPDYSRFQFVKEAVDRLLKEKNQ